MNAPRFSIIRHLDDIDNLLEFGRDGGLLPGQEPMAENIAAELIEQATQSGKRAVFFVTSPKRRAVQTAELICAAIRKKDPTIKLGQSVDPGLSAIYEGEFSLPPDYQAGDEFPGLPLGNKAFAKEALNHSPPNQSYRFGDPIRQPDGSLKYPELAPWFKSHGENNREFLSRIYRTIARALSKPARPRGALVAVVTHVQIYQIIKSLHIIATRLQAGMIPWLPGELPALHWKLFLERCTGTIPERPALHIAINNLNCTRLSELLREETDCLNAPRAADFETIKKWATTQPFVRDIRCMIIYGSAVFGSQYDKAPVDTDICVVLKNRDTDPAGIHACLCGMLADPDVTFYYDDEINSTLDCIDRAGTGVFAVEYFAHGICVAGENIFQEKLKTLCPGKLRTSYLTKSHDYILRIRVCAADARIPRDTKEKFMMKYITRLVLNILLAERAVTLPEALTIAHDHIMRLAVQHGIISPDTPTGCNTPDNTRRLFEEISLNFLHRYGS